MITKPKNQKKIPAKLGQLMSPIPINLLGTIDESHHEATSFFGLPAFPALPGAGMMASAPGAASAPPQGGVGAVGATPAQQGIDVKAEVARIEGNITLFYAGMVATALAIGVSSCLFVRSILKPAKGFHGGSSDGDMESEEDESDDESDES